MAHKPIITIIVAILLLATISGCSGNSRSESAQLRWQRTMDEARLQAAQDGLEQGRLAFAQRILRECEQCANPQSPLASQGEQIQEKIQVEYDRYAKADEEEPQSL